MSNHNKSEKEENIEVSEVSSDNKPDRVSDLLYQLEELLDNDIKQLSINIQRRTETDILIAKRGEHYSDVVKAKIIIVMIVMTVIILKILTIIID